MRYDDDDYYGGYGGIDNRFAVSLSLWLSGIMTACLFGVIVLFAIDRAIDKLILQAKLVWHSPLDHWQTGLWLLLGAVIAAFILWILLKYLFRKVLGLYLIIEDLFYMGADFFRGIFRRIFK